jgi:hypothetical protein
MKTTKYIIKGLLIVFPAALLVSGCSKVINVKLPTAASKLVIDASIDWAKHTTGNEQRIYLSTTTGYYNETFPAVSGAKIAITNATNTVFTFNETSKAGEYLCTNFKPVVGQSYRLSVTVDQVTYVATDTLMATPDIDLDIVQNDKGGMSADEMEIQYSYMDDGSRENYYMRRIKTNRVAYPILEMESDENFQGRKITAFYSHKDLKSGDSANVKLYGTSRRFFDYFRKVLNASGNNDSPFPTTPTQARGNIINQSNADDYPLGYFRLSEVAVRNYIFK